MTENMIKEILEDWMSWKYGGYQYRSRFHYSARIWHHPAAWTTDWRHTAIQLLIAYASRQETRVDTRVFFGREIAG